MIAQPMRFAILGLSQFRLTSELTNAPNRPCRVAAAAAAFSAAAASLAAAASSAAACLAAAAAALPSYEKGWRRGREGVGIGRGDVTGLVARRARAGVGALSTAHERGVWRPGRESSVQVGPGRGRSRACSSLNCQLQKESW